MAVRTRIRSALALVLPGLIWASPRLDAQQGMPAYDPADYRMSAVRVERGPTLDGRLDDEVWRLAEPAAGFTQRNPVEGAPASERTEVRIIYTDRALYIGARMFDADPDRLTITQLARDSRLEQDDNFSFVLDTFLDRRNAFVFTVNPACARHDGYITDEGRDTNSDFNVVWDACTTVDSEGWSAEIEIPLNQLRFPGGDGEQIWGINFYRAIRKNNEETYWVPTPRDLGFRGLQRLSNAGTLHGLQDLRQGTNLQVKPYVVGGGERVEQDDGTYASDSVADTGLDLKWAPTPSLTLDLTLNTDFAQVEADQERVNLTRFSLYFPEKRDFFLEGAGIFGGGGGRGYGGGGGGGGGGMGGGGQDLQLFYSRRIGLAAGEEVPIRYGTKLTGRQGPWTIGVLNVLTGGKVLADEGDEDEDEGDDDVGEVTATSWSVLSLRRNILARSSIGVLATSKDPNAGDYNRTLRLDTNFAFGTSTTIRAEVARAFDPAITGDALAFSGMFNWDTDLWNVQLQHRRIGDDFQADMGFVRRTGIRESSGQFGWSPRPGVLGIRQIMLTTEASYLTDLADRLMTRELQLRAWTFMENTANVSLNLSREWDLLDDGFTIYTDPDTDSTVTILAGPYEWTELRLNASTDSRRPLRLRGGGSWGSYYDGRRLSGDLNVTWQPSPHFGANLGLNRNQLTGMGPEADDFSTNVVNLRATWSFSPKLRFKAYVQYNDTNRAILSNYLLHWIIRDGTEIYLVYNDVFDAGPDFNPVSTGRTIMLKATYLFLF